MNQMASVYVTDVTTSSRPEKLLDCQPWVRQMSASADLKQGHVYHITAATFAPGSWRPAELVLTQMETNAKVNRGQQDACIDMDQQRDVRTYRRTSKLVDMHICRMNPFFTLSLPGQQGAFWISMSGHGLVLEPLPLGKPTPKEQTMMAVNTTLSSHVGECLVVGLSVAFLTGQLRPISVLFLMPQRHPRLILQHFQGPVVSTVR